MSSNVAKKVPFSSLIRSSPISSDLSCLPLPSFLLPFLRSLYLSTTVEIVLSMTQAHQAHQPAYHQFFPFLLGCLNLASVVAYDLAVAAAAATGARSMQVSSRGVGGMNFSWFIRVSRGLSNKVSNA